MALYEQIQEAVKAIRAKTAAVPSVGIICGTGMGALADKLTGLTKISYDTIPHFPVSTVESHHGFLCFGTLAGKSLVVMQGRFHRYEGYSLEQVTFPVRVMRFLGVKMLLIMNAVGSVNPLIRRGALCLIADHINLMGDNPLIGPNDERLGPRFPDMSEPYSKRLMAVAEQTALAKGIALHRGVAVAVTGPNLETRAEYRVIQRIGGDLVTMSTIPEDIVAVHSGLEVLGLSTVTDECYPEALEPVSVAEIIEVANSRESDRRVLIEGIIEKL
ncbi:purine-nucleoside phosphorylase [Candidatus Poribacteria bacterium]|nr:purine-nucleoside phosphorylase [Candidatus Poribacteria bacterium]